MTTYNSYEDYLLSKQSSAQPIGFDVDVGDMHEDLHDWQKESIKWNCKLGKSLNGWSMGLGKTRSFAEFAKLCHKKTNERVLIVSPLAVVNQTIREAKTVDVDIEFVRSMDDVKMANTPITIVNFDMYRAHFDNSLWRKGAVIIDESSILASYQGATKKFIIPFMNGVRYGLCASGTPMRNSYMEIGNHSEALGVMDSNQMLSNWFTSNAGKISTGEIVAGNYRLKKMGEEDFWRWVTTWALILNTPSDIDGSDDGYILPGLDIHSHVLGVDHSRAWSTTDNRGQHYLYLPSTPSSTQMWKEKKITYKQRVHKALDIAELAGDEYQVFWCDMVKEAKYLYDEMIKLYGKDNVVEVSGDDSIEDKVAKLDAFSTGQVQRIITKDTIAAMGLNWQHCAWQVLTSVNYKWESFVQRIARTNRYGQTRKTRVDLIATETEQGIMQSLSKKDSQDKEMHDRTRAIYQKFGMWRTDRKYINTDLGNTEMELSQWISK